MSKFGVSGSLQTTRLKCDLKMCYKIIHNVIAILNDDFWFSKLTHTRGHNYKLFKDCSRVNTHKYFFLNRVVEILSWCHVVGTW